MTNFYNLHVGDKVEINRVVHTIRGKSLGRDWRAIRTNHGLIPVRMGETFKVLIANNLQATAKSEFEGGY